MLHRETISDGLYETLITLSEVPELNSFYLVGGTALALQIGHRKSDDLDFFSEKSFDTHSVKQALNNLPGTATLIAEKPTGVSYFYDPPNDDAHFKIDIYNWGVKFIKPALEVGSVKMASLEDIAAFKLDAVSSRKEYKDYVDLAKLLERFSFQDLMAFYREKFPYADPRVVLAEIVNTDGIEKSVKPKMLQDLSPVEGVLKVYEAVKNYSHHLVENRLNLNSQREDQIKKLLEKKSQGRGPKL